MIFLSIHEGGFSSLVITFGMYTFNSLRIFERDQTDEIYWFLPSKPFQKMTRGSFVFKKLDIPRPEFYYMLPYSTKGSCHLSREGGYLFRSCIHAWSAWQMYSNKIDDRSEYLVSIVPLSSIEDWSSIEDQLSIEYQSSIKDTFDPPPPPDNSHKGHTIIVDNIIRDIFNWMNLGGSVVSWIVTVKNYR